MERRRNPESEMTNKELEEIENAAEDNQKAAQAKKIKEKFRQTVANTKVPVLLIFLGRMSIKASKDFIACSSEVFHQGVTVVLNYSRLGK